jgi:regulator of protease activity HflC (stomatin/prohibitin superfamily)
MGFLSFPLLLIIIYLFVSLRVLKQYERGVVFLLGKFTGVRGPGLTLIFAPFQTMTRVSLRTVTMQIPSQKIITKDNVSIDIAAVAYYHITGPERAVIVIENVYMRSTRSARPRCATWSTASASISFCRIPPASTTRSRT